jgi:hypothetical protein
MKPTAKKIIRKALVATACLVGLASTTALAGPGALGGGEPAFGTSSTTLSTTTLK